MKEMKLNPPLNKDALLENVSKKNVTIEGEVVSKVSFMDENDEIEFAYLKSNDDYYDFRNKDKIFELSTLKTNLSLENLQIVYKKYNDTKLYTFKIE